MISDWHIHTEFSNDCSTPPKKVFDAAIALGMKEVCVTDHCDFDLPEPGWVLDAERYIDTMKRYRGEYAGRLDIHIGVEIGLNPEYKSAIEDYIGKNDFEYVIGSIHTMDGKDPYYRKQYDVSDADFYKMYFDTTAERISHFDCFDTLGHLDYAVRYGYDKGRSYRPELLSDQVDAILSYIIEKGIALELNTGGLRKGLDQLHPHEEIISRYLQLGGRKFRVGSDAHFYEHVGAGFDKVEEVLVKIKKAGFSYE